MLTKRGPPFWTPNLDPILDPILDLILDPILDPYIFLEKEKYDCPCENLYKCSANANTFVSPGNATKALSNGPAFFPNAPSFFFEHTFAYFAARSLPTQARTFFRTYLTFGKRSRSLLLAEQEVGPNSFVADLEVVTNVRDIA